MCVHFVITEIIAIYPFLPFPDLLCVRRTETVSGPRLWRDWCPAWRCSSTDWPCSARSGSRRRETRLSRQPAGAAGVESCVKVGTLLLPAGSPARPPSSVPGNQINGNGRVLPSNEVSTEQSSAVYCSAVAADPAEATPYEEMALYYPQVVCSTAMYCKLKCSAG